MDSAGVMLQTVGLTAMLVIGVTAIATAGTRSSERRKSVMQFKHDISLGGLQLAIRVVDRWRLLVGASLLFVLVGTVLRAAG